MDFRTLAPGQRCQVLVVDARGGETGGGEPRLVLERDDLLLEAPNWTLDGRALILNGAGVLWRLDLETAALEEIPLTGLPALNNDHVLDPDGEHVFVSANDGHIHRAALAGGPAVRVTNDGPPELHFLHGVSPDGASLAYVGLEPEGDDLWARANIFTIPAAGGRDTRLTDTRSPDDGSEYSPDGAWLYFNTEAFESTPGHAQIARMRPDGSGLEQLTTDERVNWFPHLAPDGRTAVYVSFPPGTLGHPADRDVELRIVTGDDWTAPVRTIPVPGGQGTLNVNSWAPTSDRFAFVAYPGTA